MDYTGMGLNASIVSPPLTPYSTQGVPVPVPAQADTLDLELEKIGKTLAKMGNGVLLFVEGVGTAVSPTLVALLTNILTAVATAMISKTLAKYGIKQ